MTNRDYAPLSTACVRALHDKLYDKRKTAALEIEKMVKEFAAVNNKTQINKLLKVLGQDFAASPNQNAKKGGLIGLAAVSIALGKDTENYAEALVKPILACFSDVDSRVRYYACESLYNVMTVSRASVLPYFPHIFKKLSIIATDPDQNIKNSSELLDRLMKDIVTESPDFELEAFMPYIREQLYAKNKSPFSRHFIISWISVLYAVPNIDLFAHLPELLDGLFKVLDDPNPEVQKMCETVLGEFMRNIKSDPSKVDFARMINILIVHAQEKSDFSVQFIAITWIKEFVQLSGNLMLPYLSGIFKAILPCLSYDTDARKMVDIKETATAVNFTLMKLVSLQDMDHENGRRESVLDTGDKTEQKYDLDIKSVIEVLVQYLSCSVQTKVAVLRWFYHLYTNLPQEQMKDHIDILYPALLKTLSDSADEVVQQCLVVIAEVISSQKDCQHNEGKSYKVGGSEINPFFRKFLISLLKSFNTDRSFLEERGSFIIRQLSVLLNGEEIYCNFASLLAQEEDYEFVSLMVDHLNLILLTSAELFKFRTKLKNLEDTEVFKHIYGVWCHNPVATIALCLLTQCYEHACSLIQILGDLEITVKFLTELDKLVQLIESPIFAYLRLELLEIPINQDLVRALYGLLMILPQTEAFQTLRNRLNCIPNIQSDKPSKKQPKQKRTASIDFNELMKVFLEIQEKQEKIRKDKRAKELINLDNELNTLDT